MKCLRWFAVVPSAILAWYAAFILGLMALSGIDALCPPETMISGFCGVWWYPHAERAIILAAVALSAFLVVISASAVAPSYRVHVARLAYGVGVVVATYFVVKTSAVGEFMAAILAGLLGVFRVARCSASPSRP